MGDEDDKKTVEDIKLALRSSEGIDYTDESEAKKNSQLLESMKNNPRVKENHIWDRVLKDLEVFVIDDASFHKVWYNAYKLCKSYYGGEYKDVSETLQRVELHYTEKNDARFDVIKKNQEIVRSIILFIDKLADENSDLPEGYSLNDFFPGVYWEPLWNAYMHGQHGVYTTEPVKWRSLTAIWVRAILTLLEATDPQEYRKVLNRLHTMFEAAMDSGLEDEARHASGLGVIMALDDLIRLEAESTFQDELVRLLDVLVRCCDRDRSERYYPTKSKVPLAKSIRQAKLAKLEEIRAHTQAVKHVKSLLTSENEPAEFWQLLESLIRNKRFKKKNIWVQALSEQFVDGDITSNATWSSNFDMLWKGGELKPGQRVLATRHKTEWRWYWWAGWAKPHQKGILDTKGSGSTWAVTFDGGNETQCLNANEILICGNEDLLHDLYVEVMTALNELLPNPVLSSLLKKCPSFMSRWRWYLTTYTTLEMKKEFPSLVAVLK